MATGVKPRDEDIQLTRTDLEAIQDAMKSKHFRDLLHDYVEEVRDPANQALYQKEMTQLEKERGYDVTFINPKGGYVIKTSVAGDRKAFINICSNENVAKPSCSVQEIDGQRGMNWQIPYSIIPPRNDYDHKREKCVIYDVVFHSDTLRMAEVNKRFRELVNKTAIDGLQKTYNIHLDSNNCRFPKSNYKGMITPAVIRTEDPDYKPPDEEETEDLSPEILEKLYPQRTYSQKTEEPMKHSSPPPQQQKRRTRKDRAEFSHATENGYTVPKFIIKQQKNIDFQDFTYNKNSKQYSAIPTQIVVEINLPLLTSTNNCILDVKEKSLHLTSEKPAKYKLNVALPYFVNEECGNAKFDKTKRKLIVTLPVINKTCPSADPNSLKVDSGVESEENSGSQSEEENMRENLVVELSSKPAEPAPVQQVEKQGSISKVESFIDSSHGYILPPYTHNVLDDIIAFTFHIKNTDPDSVKVQKDGNEIYIKFTSVGCGFVPVHYAAIIVLDECDRFENVTGEAWDNNVILQVELANDIPKKFQIGLNRDNMTNEYFDISHVKKTTKMEIDANSEQAKEENTAPVVEVTNLGSETNIVVSSNSSEYDEDDDVESPTTKEKEIVWTETSNCENGAKSILRKPIAMMRSFSESSADIASSMDYISSDCIPEESSFKKTVRFNDVIARQFYRYNSSIEGQKKKNQRKKSKKRTQDRRKSESEAEDDFVHSSQKPKSVLKQRRDSGLADTSDAENELKQECEGSYDSNTDNYHSDGNESNTPDVRGSLNSVLNIVENGNKKEKKPAIWKSECETKDCKLEKDGENPGKSDLTTCNNIKHNTEFYNPEKLNKGQYLEIAFKNDLIFDLDM